MWNLVLEKEKFKFAVSHFAIFGPYCGERLHGHNYYVKIEFVVDSLDENLGLGVEFNEVKPAIYEVCQSLDEYVLLPENSPYLKIEEDPNYPENSKITFADKTYSLPKSDVKQMPLLNVSCEELSRWMALELKPQFIKYKNIKSLKVTIQETRGQRAQFSVDLSSK